MNQMMIMMGKIIIKKLKKMNELINNNNKIYTKYLENLTKLK